MWRHSPICPVIAVIVWFDFSSSTHVVWNLYQCCLVETAQLFLSVFPIQLRKTPSPSLPHLTSFFKTWRPLEPSLPHFSRISTNTKSFTLKSPFKPLHYIGNPALPWACGRCYFLVLTTQSHPLCFVPFPRRATGLSVNSSCTTCCSSSAPTKQSILTATAVLGLYLLYCV